MYKDHFRLRAMPFSIAPDPSYFYLSNQHRDALTHLRHALEGDAGVVLLTGEVGTGKTAVCRRLLTELPRDVDVALIHNPRLSPRELLATLCQEFGIAGAAEESARTELLRLVLGHITAAEQSGRKSVLIIDEAQNLGSDVLEQLRQLGGVLEQMRQQGGARREAAGGLRIVLIGQPELNDLLAQPQNARFNEAIGMRFHLGPLVPSDVEGYVQHRLGVAGCSKPLIPHRLMPRLYRMSRGIPRVINLICDRALLGAYVMGKDAVNGRILKAAHAEAVGHDEAGPAWRRLMPLAIGGIGALAAGACVAVVLRTTLHDGPSAALPSAQAAASAAEADPSDPADWPEAMAGARSEALAFAALLKRWNVAPGSEPPCSPRIGTGLRCVQGRDEFEALRRLNVPAVLELKDRRGQTMHVALVEVNRDRAVLQLGDTVRQVPVRALEARWTRQYIVLWRPPPALDPNVGIRAGSPQVEWLRQRIATLKGVEARTLPPRLDGALKAQLQAFQTDEGLRATGVGDLRTLVHLASRTEPDAPVLEAAPTCRR